MISLNDEKELEAKKAIADSDVLLSRKLKAFLVAKHGEDFNQEIQNMSDMIDRFVHNLSHAPLYYRELKSDSKANWYHAQCPKCGWFGSSRFLQGGGAIADSGDYDDAYCPICHNPDLN